MAKAKKPRKRKPRAPDVTCDTTVTFKDDPDLSDVHFGKHIAYDEEGKATETVLPAGIKGGVVRPQTEEERAAKQVRATTTSGKTLRKFKLNASHAEYHAAAWVDGLLTTEGGTRRKMGDVTAVKFVLTGKYSPCRECANTLTDVAQRFPNAELTFDYSAAKALHSDWDGNESACLAAIKGWNVIGFTATQDAKGVQLKKVKT